jgi:MoaA/NifB/PqqE/SkfB family radical SAM enzyme
MLEYAKGLVSLILKQRFALNQPITLNVDTSNLCNLQCKMCYRNESYFKSFEKKYLLPETLEKIYSQIRPKILLLGGISGEPLTNPDIDKLVEIGSKNGSKTIMTSNGLLLNKDLSTKLIKAGIHLLKISMDAATPETYKIIRKSNFDALINRMQEFQEIRKDNGIKRDILRMDFVIQRDNLNDVIPFLNLAKKLGVTVVNYVPVNYSQFTDETKELFSKEHSVSKIVEVLSEGKRLAKQLGIKTTLGNLLKGIEKLGNPDNYIFKEGDCYFPWYRYTRSREIFCMNPWLQLGVYYNGDVSICCNAFSNIIEKGLVIGNIYRDNIQDIWNGANLQKIRQLFRDYKNYKCFDVCKVCIQKVNIWHEIRMNNL